MQATGGSTMLGMEWIPVVLSLLVGLFLGWYGHNLTQRRTRAERVIADATELWDRCADIANARVKYILAYHRKQADSPQLNEDHKDIKRRYRWADPEIVLVGTPEWEAYHDAERAALDRSVPVNERIRAVEATSYPLFEAIGRRRTAARGR